MVHDRRKYASGRGMRGSSPQIEHRRRSPPENEHRTQTDRQEPHREGQAWQ
jgi:hypothetical protein